MDDYTVTLGFKETFMPYYGKGGTIYNYHHGIDIVPKSGKALNHPVKLRDGTTLGFMGNTGAAEGVHTHVDKNVNGSRNLGDYRDPKDWYNIAGVVTFAGLAGTAGNMVIIKADNGHFYRFLHFNKINVKVGQKVGGKMTVTDTAKQLKHLRGQIKPPTTAQITFFKNKSFEEGFDHNIGTKTHKDLMFRQGDGWKKINDEKDTLLKDNRDQANEIAQLEADLAAVGEDTKNLNKLGEVLRWLIARLGVKG